MGRLARQTLAFLNFKGWKKTVPGQPARLPIAGHGRNIAAETATANRFAADAGMTADALKGYVEVFEFNGLRRAASALPERRLVCCKVRPFKPTELGYDENEVTGLLRSKGYRQVLGSDRVGQRPSQVISERYPRFPARARW